MNEKEYSGRFIYPAMLSAMLFWGLSFIASKYALQEMTPVAAVAVRLFLASFMMIILLFIKRKNNPLPPLRALPAFALLGLLNPAATFLLESTGMITVSASLASLIMATLPLITPIASFLILRERFTFWNVAGLVLSFLGVGIILISKQHGLDFTTLGIIFLFGSVFCSVFYTILAKQILNNYTPFTVVTFQQLFGFLFLLPLFIFREAGNFFRNPPPIPNLLAVFYLALFASTISYSLFNYGLRHLGTTKANAFINITPVITALASYFILGELFSLQKIAGMILVVGGLFLSQKKIAAMRRVKVR